VGKRLEEMVECLRCHSMVNPFVVEHVPEIAISKTQFTPERIAVVCPRSECNNLWYITVNDDK